MKTARFWLAIAALVFLLPSFRTAVAKNEFFNVEDLKPGMKGIGKTCYQGTKPEEFQVEILGVLHGVNPGASAVLARFSGGLLDKTGVFEGMSGSPVFVDGKLLGAVAFSFTFAKEAIGGITPITQMVGAFEEVADPSSGPKIILNKSSFWKFRQSSVREFGISPGDVAREPGLAAFGGHELIPIATPLSLGGFSSETLKVFAPKFKSMGMSVLQGSGGSGQAAAGRMANEADTSPLEPGSNIIVSLVRGDLDVSAGGTVTYVDGNKLYAFGHNMFELGYTELPMHRGKAITIFPSLQSSFKILEAGGLAGTIRQDRGMGIYGIIGEKPRMIPLKVHLTTSRGAKKELSYELARDPFLTPLLVNLTVYNSIIASERAQGVVTLSVKGKIQIKNEQPIEVDSRFSSDSSAPASASLAVALPVNYVMSAGYKNLDLEKIDIDISAQERDQAAVLDSIRANRTEVKAGDSIELEIFYKKANGEVLQDTYPVKVPISAMPGPLTLLVADGTTLMAIDDQEEGEGLIPRDLTQLIKLINSLRKSDRLYLRFIRQEPGAVIRGEGLPGLPPSILSILKSERKSGAINSIQMSTLLEYEFPTSDNIMMGSRTLKIVVRP
jgi:hypothetical protein